MNADRFIFGVDPYPNWFKDVHAKYIYSNNEKVLIAVVITNPTGDVLTAHVGDTILRIPNPDGKPLCVVISALDESR